MRKRKKKKIKRTIKLFLTLIFVLLSVLVFSFYKGNLFDKNNIKDEIKTKVKKEEEKWPKVYKAKLAATGDAVLHMAVINDGKKSDGTYDFSNQLSFIKDAIADYDIKYYNQETIFGGDDRGFKGYPLFNSPTAYGDAMIEAGFNTVSLATNHSLDQGERGILNAYDYWSSKDGIMFNGIANSQEAQSNYIISEVNNITYAMLSYTTLTNGLTVPSGKSYLLNTYSEDLVKKDIAYLRDKVDVLIVAMHWGVEYTTTPTNEELEIAKFLASQNVDIVLGAHPHCIQPIDIIDNTIVYYSLGNFISNQGDIANKYGIKVIIGMLGTLDITKTVDKDNTTIEIDNVGADLLYTYNNNHHNYKVIPFSKITSNYLSNFESVYNEFSAIATKYNSDIKIAPLMAS